MPYIIYKDGDGSEKNIHDMVKGPKFHVFIFSKDNDEDFSFNHLYKDIMMVHYIPWNHQTQALYKRFGIKRYGLYLIRPDMYIAYRSSKLHSEHFEIYLRAVFIL